VPHSPASRRSFDLAHEVPGAPPGTLHIHSEDAPTIHMLDYGPDREEVEEFQLARIEDCVEHVHKEGVTWVDIRGIGHAPTFKKLGEIFKIHPLALEDMVNVPQRPKTEIFKDQQLIITRMATLHDGKLTTEQFAILFGRGFVVTVQEEPRFDCLDSVRLRLRQGRSGFRTRGSDYLASALLDAVIDGFYPVLEHFGEELDELEAEVLGPRTVEPQSIFALKREFLTLRRAIWPQRDLLSQLIRDESVHIDAETRPYFRDSYDHCVQVIDMVETFREISSSLMDQLMTRASNRLNEVMKVLTVLSTIFLPMTFIAGVYGMNFDTQKSRWNMPELEWTLGYPFSLGLMAASSIGLLFYYRRMGWIGRKNDTYSRLMKVLDRPKRRLSRNAAASSR
jgi:magnesium transporter